MAEFGPPVAPRKKKDDLAMYLPIGIAVVAGGYLFWRSSKASAAPTPLPIKPPAPPVAPVKPGKQRKDAPRYSGNAAAEVASAQAWASVWNIQVAQEMGQNGNETATPTEQDVLDARKSLGIPAGRTVASWLADKTYKELYSRAWKIPAKADRGKNWDPYIKAWKRMWNAVKAAGGWVHL